MSRSIYDNIILTIFPHLFSLFYTINNISYSSLILISTLSSVLWHLDREKNKFLFFDYMCALFLFLYEINIGIEYKILKSVVYSNILLVIMNKTILILSINKKINYIKWHSMFHLMSSLKTFFIAYLSFNFTVKF